MTSEDMQQHYEQFASGEVTIESQFHTNLTEHLNAEVVLRTVQSTETAMDWLRSTFLYVRMLAAPEKYGAAQANVDSVLRTTCDHCIEKLCQHGIVDRSQSNTLLATGWAHLEF